MRRLAVVAMAIALAGAGCTGGDTVRSGEASLVIDPGSRVLVAERDEGLRQAEGRRTLHLGAQVKVLAGTASVTLDDGARLDLREGSEVALGSPVSLIADDLLVTSGKKPIKIAAAGSQVLVDGVANVSRDLAVSAATYRGTATLRSAARSLAIPALREAAVPSFGVLPAAAKALTYDPADAWDRRYLGAAIDFGEELEAKSEGFTRSLGPGEGRAPGFYRLLLPKLEQEPAFGEDLLAIDYEPGDLLVGAAIAISGKVGSFADRWAGVFAFRDQGAKWGLVALDQGVDDIAGLVGAVDAAIGGQTFAFAPPAGGPAPVDPPLPVTPPPPSATAPGAQAPRPAEPAPRPAPATSTPARPAPLLALPEILPPADPADPAEPGEGLLAPLVDVVTNTLDGLLSGPAASP